MKGKMKKLVALALATIMVLAMGITAAAANVTIQGAAKGATYTAYKIFNVKATTVTVDGEEKEVASYTRPANEDLAGDYSKVFTKVDNGGELYYELKEKVGASDIVAYLGTKVEVGGEEKTVAELSNLLETAVTATNPADSESTTVQITLPDEGYYYIVSSEGPNAILRAVDSKTTIITEKNDNPGWGDDENSGKKSYNANGEEDAFYAIGEIVKYEITYANARNYGTVTKEVENPDTGEIEEVVTNEKIYEYVAKDTMPKGVEIILTETEDEEGNVIAKAPVIKVGNQALTESTDGTNAKNTYTGTIEAGKIDIKIPWAATHDDGVEDSYYDVPSVITITYYARITDQVNVGADGSSNKVTIDYNGNTKGSEIENKIYTGSLDVLKYDGTGLGDEVTAEQVSNATKLSGAVFVVAKGTETTVNGETTVTITDYVKKDTDGTISLVKDVEDATPLETGEDGKSKTGPLTGLDQGTYYLVEIQSPEGYNLLATPLKVTIAAAEEIAEVEAILKKDSATPEEIAAAKEKLQTLLVQVPSIANSTGTLLPSTGGIGTTIFYVVGGILVVCAGVLLITKKRMSKHN